jgi:hypothetical protein
MHKTVGDQLVERLAQSGTRHLRFGVGAASVTKQTIGNVLPFLGKRLEVQHGEA